MPNIPGIPTHDINTDVQSVSNHIPDLTSDENDDLAADVARLKENAKKQDQLMTQVMAKLQSCTQQLNELQFMNARARASDRQAPEVASSVPNTPRLWQGRSGG